MASVSCSSGGGQSTRLALAASSLVLVLLFASTAPCAEAFARGRPWATTADAVHPLSVKFLNNLTQSLNVTTTGAPPSTTLAPGASATLAVDAQAPLQFQVDSALYVDDASGHGSTLGSLMAEVGVLSIAVGSGPCAAGQAGLTLVGYADEKLVNSHGCAVLQ